MKNVQKSNRKSMVCILLTLLMSFTVLAPITGKAISTVENSVLSVVSINIENFPDEAFRNKVRNICDKNFDGNLSQEEIESVEQLDLSNCGINDLTGISFFYNLKYLNCSGNNLDCLNVGENNNLNYLNCENNNLAELTLLKNKTWTTNAHRGNISGYGGSIKENTLAAYNNAYFLGADVIECDARLSKDNVFMCNHDPDVIDINGSKYIIKDCDSEKLQNIVLNRNNEFENQGVPTLENVLQFASKNGLNVDIDLKMDGLSYSNLEKKEFAKNVAKLVVKCGMQGKATYAISVNGSLAIPEIIAIDPDATFTTTKERFDAISNLSTILPDYQTRCYAYTSDLSSSNINSIRDKGYLLELTEINSENFREAVKYNPDAIEFIHTANFKQIEEEYFYLDLNILMCSNNNLSNLNLSNLPNLVYLNCENNGLSELDLTYNENLQELYCNNNLDLKFKMIPLSVEASYAEIDSEIVVTIIANEIIQPIKGWELSCNKHTLTKTYNENIHESVIVRNIAGEEVKVDIIIDDFKDASNNTAKPSFFEKIIQFFKNFIEKLKNLFK